MKLLLSFIFAFINLFNFSPIYAQEIPEQPDFFYVYYDQNFNVIRRLKIELKKLENPNLSDLEKSGLETVWMSEEKITPQKVFLVELSKRTLDTSDFKSSKNEIRIQNLDPRLLKRMTGPGGGRLVPVFENDLSHYRNKGDIIAETVAYRLLGRDSWYLAPTDESYGGVFFKRIKDIPLYREKADRAIHMVNYLESGKHLLPDDLQDLFLSEQLYLTVPFLFENDRLIYRSAEVLHNTSDTEVIFPLHGLLGTNLSFSARNLKDFAQKMNLSEKDWKKVFLIPQLARITAYLHLALGVSLENHTQNILVVLDKTTGELKKIYLRDLGDGLLNPLPRLIHENSFSSLTDVLFPIKFKSLAYHSWIEPNKSELTEIGYNTSVFTGQSLDSHGRTFEERMSSNVLFIELYKKNIESIAGQNFDYSEESLKVLNSLKSALQIEDIYTSTFNKKGRLDSAVAFVIEELYQKAIAHMIRDKVSPFVSFQIDQSHAMSLFKNAILENRVSFLNLETRNSLVPAHQQSWLGEKTSHYIKLPDFAFKKFKGLQFGVFNSTLWAYDQNFNPLGVIYIDSSIMSLKTFLTKYNFATTPKLQRNINVNPTNNFCTQFLKTVR